MSILQDILMVADPVALAAAAYLTSHRYRRRVGPHAEAKVVKDPNAELLERCEKQNQLFLSGDPAGLYGACPPIDLESLEPLFDPEPEPEPDPKPESKGWSDFNQAMQSIQKTMSTLDEVDDKLKNIERGLTKNGNKVGVKAGPPSKVTTSNEQRAAAGFKDLSRNVIEATTNTLAHPPAPARRDQDQKIRDLCDRRAHLAYARRMVVEAREKMAAGVNDSIFSEAWHVYALNIKRLDEEIFGIDEQIDAFNKEFERSKQLDAANLLAMMSAPAQVISAEAVKIPKHVCNYPDRKTTHVEAWGGGIIKCIQEEV